MADDDRSSTSSTRKKSASKSTTKSTGRKSTGKKASKSSSSDGSSSSRRRGAAPRAESSPSASPLTLASTAAQQLLELTGKAPEGVIGLEKNDSGWRVQVEVVEVRRIPNTTDVLALYEIDADDKGNLQGYRRIRRYARGVPGED
jgi:hypothetical protein